MAAPEVARTAADMAGRAIVVKLDTERYPEVASRFNVRGVPNFVVFNAGHPVTQQAGVATSLVTLKLLVQDPNGYFIPNIRRERQFAANLAQDSDTSAVTNEQWVLAERRFMMQHSLSFAS